MSLALLIPGTRRPTQYRLRLLVFLLHAPQTRTIWFSDIHLASLYHYHLWAHHLFRSRAFSAFHVQSPTSEDSPPALLLNFDPNDSQSSLCDWFFGHHSSPKTCAMFFSSSLDPSTSAVLAPRESLLVAFPGTDPPWVSAYIHFFYYDSVFYCP